MPAVPKLNVLFSALVVLVGAVCLVTKAGSEELERGARQTFRDCANCPEMVVLPAGNFFMGSSEQDVARDVAGAVPFNEASYVKERMEYEKPQHPVEIARPFALGRYLVTRDEFAAFADETGYSIEKGCTFWVNHRYPVQPDGNWKYPGFKQTGRDPVVCISWRDAKAYINWLNSKSRGATGASDGGPYRLPSEAEWEYAARAGNQTARWWGDSLGSGSANCDGCGSRWDRKQTSPAGSFGINPFGLADVLGNAWEWTEDCWDKDHAGAPQDGSARTDGDCDLRVMRGGSWNSHPWILRSANRGRIDATERANDIGFRVAKTLQ